ncbi:MAG: S8 family serine peptidase, partial [candidate division Zixibacteria bacterium]
TMYGPAYKANFLLAKTEDVRSETPVEEDNWVAAVEWADALGVDVISSSLSYSAWYTYADMDGQTATITIMANTAAAMGIVIVNSAGNSGPGAGTMTAPADAFEVISCGAVNSFGNIASFSSRGPTYDGRIKPEVVALGVSAFVPSPSGDNSYTTASGTSFSCPLTGGVATVLLQARPTFTPQMVRSALMETADRASNPDNSYGWGLIDLGAALGWGANFYADTTFGDAPITVQFFDSSTVSPTDWLWTFGDGNSSILQNPQHQFTIPGAYNVSLTVQSSLGEITNIKTAYVLALGDTLEVETDSVWAGDPIEISVNLTNSQELREITIPLVVADSPINVKLIAADLGSRTASFQSINFLTYNGNANEFTFNLLADVGEPGLPPGSGEIMKLTFTTNAQVVGGVGNVMDTTTLSGFSLSLTSPQIDYTPRVSMGTLRTKYVLRGDLTGDYTRDISDLTMLVNLLFLEGDPPPTIQHSDLTGDFTSDISDLTFLVNYLFLGGDEPQSP